MEEQRSWVRLAGFVGSVFARRVVDYSILSAARRITDTIDGWLSVKEDWNLAIIDIAVGATIYDAPAIIGNIYVDTVLTGSNVSVQDDAIHKFNVPGASAFGFSFTVMKGARFETALKIPAVSGGTGVLVVQWRKL